MVHGGSRQSLWVRAGLSGLLAFGLVASSGTWSAEAVPLATGGLLTTARPSTAERPAPQQSLPLRQVRTDLTRVTPRGWAKAGSPALQPRRARHLERASFPLIQAIAKRGSTGSTGATQRAARPLDTASASASNAAASITPTVDINPGAVSTLTGDGSTQVVDGPAASSAIQYGQGLHVIGGYGYFSDTSYIRRVDLATGATQTVAGGGSGYYPVDSTDPLAATLPSPGPLADDGTYLYFLDACNTNVVCLRRMSLTSGAVSTITLSTTFSSPSTLAVGPDGTVYVGNFYGAVYRVDVAGSTATQLVDIPRSSSNAEMGTRISGMTADADGLWLTLWEDRYWTQCCNRVVHVDPATGAVSAVTTPGDAAILPRLNDLVSAGDNLYVLSGTQIFRVTKSTGAATPVAGAENNRAGYLDGTGAEAWFTGLKGVDVSGSELVVLDAGDHRIRSVIDGPAPTVRQPAAQTQTLSVSPALMTSLAGNGAQGVVDGTGSNASLSAPQGMHVIGHYGYFFDALYLRRVDLDTGTITTVAGTSTYYAGNEDSTVPASVGLGGRSAMADDGSFLYFVNGCNQTDACLRRMSLATGAVSNLPLAKRSNLSAFTALTMGPDGRLYAGEGNHVYRIEVANGLTSTFATLPPSDVNGPYHVEVTGITSDATDVWVTVREAYYSICCSGIRRVPLDGSAPSTLVMASYDQQAHAIAPILSAGGYLYSGWTSEQPGYGNRRYGIARFAKSTGIPDPIITSDLLTGVVGLDRYDDELVVADSNERQVFTLVQAPPSFEQPGPYALAGGGNLALNNGPCSCADPVSTATGEFWEQVTDLALPGRSPVVAQRTYSSARAAAEPGLLGPGWSTPWDAHVTAGLQTVVTQENGSTATFSRSNNGTFDAPSNLHATLTRDAASGAYTFVRQGTSTLSFDTNGRLTSMKDLGGETTQLTWSSSQLTVAVADGRVLTFAIGAGGHATGLSGPATRAVAYGYDGSGRLHTVTDSRGKVWTYDYDAASGRLSDLTTPMGAKTTNVYDSAGRVSTQTGPRGGVTTFAYTPGSHAMTTRVTDPTGVTTDYGYQYGLLQSRTLDPAGASPSTWSYTYDTSGNQTSATDPTGVVTFATFDNTGNAVSLTDGAGNVTAVTYNGAHQPLTVTDPAGHTSAYSYSGGSLVSAAVPQSASVTATTGYTYDTTHAADLTKVTDPEGRTTTLTRTPEGFLASSRTDLDGATTTYTYNAYGDLLTAVAAKGNATGAVPAAWTTTNTYDGAGLLLTSTDPLGHITTYAYDDDRRLLTVKDALNHVTTNEWNADGTLRTTTDPLTRVTSHTYDLAGRPLTDTAADGGTTSRTYDSKGRLATLTTPSGNAAGVTTAQKSARTLTFTNDLAGRSLSSSQPDPNGGSLLEVTAYDSAGRTWKVTNAANETATTTYDNRNLVATTTDSAGKVTTYGYDWAGHVTSTTDPMTHVDTASYTPSGQLASSSDALGHATTYTYDGAGRLKTVVDPRGTCSGCTAANYTVTKAYDLNGNLATVTDQLGHVTTYAYDNDDRLASVADAKNHATGYTYDAADRMLTVKAPDTGTTTYGYDVADQMTSVKSPRGYTTTYAYDPVGRPKSATNPLAKVQSRTYDLDGTLATEVTARGNAATSPATPAAGTITYTNDALGRPTAVSYGDGATGLAFAYDKASRRTSMTDAAGTQSYQYDAAGRPSKITRGTASLTYTYYDDGTPKTTTRPDASVETWTYDAAARPTKVVNPVGTTTYTWDAADHLLTSAMPNATTETQTWDRAGYLSKVATTKSTTVLTSQTVTRDAANNPTQVAVARGASSETRSFLYDPNDRLTAVCYTVLTSCTGTSVAAQAWTYDLDGNRATEKNGTGTGTTTTYTYNTADQLTSRKVGTAAAVASTYDADGNTLTDGTATWTYDLNNRAKTGLTGTTTQTFQRDGEGNILKQTASSTGSSTIYLWDLNREIPAMVNVDGAQTHSYRIDPLGRQATAVEGGSTANTEAHDIMGTPTDLVSTTGVIARSVDWTPFGSTRAAIGAPTGTGQAFSLGFGAIKTSNVNGTSMTRDRMYDPALGRWTGTDPIATPLGQVFDAPYTYVANQPTMYVDPLGDSACDHLFGLCDSPEFFMNEVIGARDAAIDLGSVAIHPVRSYNQTVGACSAGFDQWSGGTGVASWSGLAQCIDNLNPIATIRDDLIASLSTNCIQASGQAFGAGLFNSGAVLAPGAKGLGLGVPVTRPLAGFDWADDTGSVGSGAGDVAAANRFARQMRLPADSPVVQHRSMTVADFVSKYRKASVRSQLPGEYLGMTVEDALKAAAGEKNTTVRKMLIDGRFSK